jgi:hypothetical protein
VTYVNEEWERARQKQLATRKVDQRTATKRMQEPGQLKKGEGEGEGVSGRIITSHFTPSKIAQLEHDTILLAHSSKHRHILLNKHLSLSLHASKRGREEDGQHFRLFHSSLNPSNELRTHCSVDFYVRSKRMEGNRK